MGRYDEVEAALERLIPPAISETAQREMDALIDDLAGDAQTAGIMTSEDCGRGLGKYSWTGVGVAAALVLGVWLAVEISPKQSEAETSASAKPPVGVVLVGESDRVESMADEGWSEHYDGATMRTMRLNVVEENSFLDEKTGIVMQVLEPREEILYMPVTTF